MIDTKEYLSELKPMDKGSAADFEPYRYRNTFADTTFAMLYSWHEHFDYRYKDFGEVLAVTGVDNDGERVFMLLRKNDEAPVDEAVSEICRMCRESGGRAIFEYVASSELPLYRKAADACGMTVSFSYDDKYSDYIYETENFVSMKGSSFKNKRGGYNYLLRCCPEIRTVPYTDSLYGVCMGMFDTWCARHNCEDCFYGCEKKAFINFMDIYDPERHKIMLSYNGDTPLSFIVYEQINNDTMCYYFQKNTIRQRGLTYWLNREAALQHMDIKYINLEEDMGIPGIAEDKRSLRPCGKLEKYTAVFE
ncbi:MAG: phosphatidylglycerol lysyltransferase domain-containing protein [Huintestinicola sp.]